VSNKTAADGQLSPPIIDQTQSSMPTACERSKVPTEAVIGQVKPSQVPLPGYATNRALADQIPFNMGSCGRTCLPRRQALRTK
jgi:hypothetical protein